MAYDNGFFIPKTKFLVLGTADPKHVLDILKRHKYCVWHDDKQCYDVIENKSDITDIKFTPKDRMELDLDEHLVAYSGTDYGLGVVVGLDLDDAIWENKTLKQIREELTQILRENGAYVMPSELTIMFGECLR